MNGAHQISWYGMVLLKLFHRLYFWHIYYFQWIVNGSVVALLDTGSTSTELGTQTLNDLFFGSIRAVLISQSCSYSEFGSMFSLR